MFPALFTIPHIPRTASLYKFLFVAYLTHLISYFCFSSLGLSALRRKWRAPHGLTHVSLSRLSSHCYTNDLGGQCCNTVDRGHCCNNVESHCCNNGLTVRRGRVISTPASYSRGARFKSRTGDRLSWQISCGFPQCLQANPGIYLNLGHDRFLPISNSLFTNPPLIRRLSVEDFSHIQSTDWDYRLKVSWCGEPLSSETWKAPVPTKRPRADWSNPRVTEVDWRSADQLRLSIKRRPSRRNE
jgi:hypothetical protein